MPKSKTCEKENHEWFEKNLYNLVPRYCDRYVVIKDKAVVASYASYEDAVGETLKTEKEGAFSIELCALDMEKPNFEPKIFPILITLLAAAFIAAIGLYPLLQWLRKL
jgi:hypothetical protein